MSQVLGVGSPEAKALQQEMVKRMAMMSDPAVPVANNPDLLASIEATNKTADQIIASTAPALTSAVEADASAGLVDLFFLMARTTWIDDNADIDRLVPAPSRFMAWLARLLRPAM